MINVPSVSQISAEYEKQFKTSDISVLSSELEKLISDKISSNETTLPYVVETVSSGIVRRGENLYKKQEVKSLMKELSGLGYMTSSSDTEYVSAIHWNW